MPLKEHLVPMETKMFSELYLHTKNIYPNWSNINGLAIPLHDCLWRTNLKEAIGPIIPIGEIEVIPYERSHCLSVMTTDMFPFLKLSHPTALDYDSDVLLNVYLLKLYDVSYI